MLWRNGVRPWSGKVNGKILISKKGNNVLMKKLTQIKAVMAMTLLIVTGQAHLGREPCFQPTEQPWESGATTVTLSQDGVLRVIGKGAMENYIWYYYTGSRSPWESAICYNVAPPIAAVVIETGVTHIGNNAFAEARVLMVVTISKDVTTIGRGAFRRCSRLGTVTIPNSVTSIGEDAFEESGLTSVIIPGSVLSIENSAFSSCLSLTSVTIEDGVKYIGERAFVACTSLTFVAIPGSVVAIGERAFAFCNNLKVISISGSTLPQLDSEAFFAINADAKVAILRKGREVYMAANGWDGLTVPPEGSRLKTLGVILTTIIILATVALIIIKKSKNRPPCTGTSFLWKRGSTR
jgi:hypothetical protein